MKFYKFKEHIKIFHLSKKKKKNKKKNFNSSKKN